MERDHTAAGRTSLDAHTSPHSWTHREMKGGTEDDAEGVEPLHLRIYQPSLHTLTLFKLTSQTFSLKINKKNMTVTKFTSDSVSIRL